MLGNLLLPTREHVEAYLRGALGDNHGDNCDGEGGGSDRGGDKWVEVGGAEGGEQGGKKEADTGVRRGVPGARICPNSLPPHRTGSLRVATPQRGAAGPRG